MWRLFTRTICLFVRYTNYLVVVVTLLVVFISSTYNRCLTGSSSNSPLSLRVFSSLPFTLSVRLSVTFCVSAIHTRTHTWVVVDTARSVGDGGGCCVGRAGGARRCGTISVSVCERRYRQVVFIIIVFFPRRIRRETPTVHVHNNTQQQYKSFVNNTSTLTAARRRVVAPPSECVVVSEWGVPVVRENKMYTRLLSRHETVYPRFIYWNSSYFTRTLLYIMWDVERGGAARIPSNPPWPNFPNSVV